jgi:hypothetical protein
MTVDEASEIIAAVKRVCPRQEFSDVSPQRWSEVLVGLKLSECLIAVGALGPISRGRITLADIRGRVESIRKNRQEPTGEAYWEAFARRGGREYEGGPVLWDPDEGGRSV